MDLADGNSTNGDVHNCEDMLIKHNIKIYNISKVGRGLGFVAATLIAAIEIT